MKNTRNKSVDLLVVLVTTPAGEDAERMARCLVGEHLAACVNIVPGCQSVYRWQGSVESDREDLLVVKTRADLLDALAGRVGELHPYDVPEFIALEPLHVSQDYADYVNTACAASDEIGPVDH